MKTKTKWAPMPSTKEEWLTFHTQTVDQYAPHLQAEMDAYYAGQENNFIRLLYDHMLELTARTLLQVTS